MYSNEVASLNTAAVPEIAGNRSDSREMLHWVSAETVSAHTKGAFVVRWPRQDTSAGFHRVAKHRSRRASLSITFPGKHSHTAKLITYPIQRTSPSAWVNDYSCCKLSGFALRWSLATTSNSSNIRLLVAALSCITVKIYSVMLKSFVTCNSCSASVTSA
jgi:hypothetical protein